MSRRADLRRLAAALMLCLAASSGAQQPPAAEPADDRQIAGRVAIDLEPEQVTVGDRVRAVITVVWMGEPPTEPARFPTWQETWGDAEVLELSEVEAFEDQSKRFVFRQVLELAAFKAGDVDLPARTFAVPLGENTVELRSEPTGFTVTSLLPEPAEGEEQAEPLSPRGEAPPIELESRKEAFLATLAGFSLLILAGLETLRRRLAVDPAVVEAAARVDPLTLLAPLAELEARLEQLDPQHPEAAHTALSLALRRFLARRLGFPAVESTTTEIQRRLVGRGAAAPAAGRAALAPQIGQSLLGLLQQCDLVKFAGAAADAASVRRRVDQARELGRRLEAQLMPPEATEAADREIAA